MIEKNKPEDPPRLAFARLDSARLACRREAGATDVSEVKRLYEIQYKKK